MDFTIIDITLDEAILKYENDWSKLVRENELNPSMLPGWMACVAKAFQLYENYRVTVLESEGIVYAIAPYFLEKKYILGSPMNCIHLGGNLVSYHQSFIFKEQNEILLKIIIEYFNNKYSWALLIVAELDINSWSHTAISEFCRKGKLKIVTIQGDSSPYLALGVSWDELLASLSRKFRYKVNRREKDMLKNCDINVHWYSEEQDCNILLKNIFNIEKNSWKVAENMDITGRPSEKKYYELLIPFMAKEGVLLANVLEYKGEAIAYNLCYNFNGNVGQIKTSYKEAYSTMSPGALVLEEALRYFIRNGYSEFDFLGNVMQHKLLWTKVTRNHERLILYSNNISSKLYYSYTSLRRGVRNLLTKILSLKNIVTSKKLI